MGCGLGFFTGAFAGFDAPNPAVPRYGTVVVDDNRVGFTALGAGAGRGVPFVCAGLAGASFRCIFAWTVSTEPDALRFKAGASGARFADPAGRGAAFGDPASGLAAGDGAGVVADAPGPREERRSLNVCRCQQKPHNTVAYDLRS
jgi:hypothetical protein